MDAYGTVQPHTLIRQHMDYGHWYDRVKLSLKDIHNVQYVAAMNPTAGSFTVSHSNLEKWNNMLFVFKIGENYLQINPRLQRHFAVFSLSFPGQDAVQSIYKTILQQHLASHIHKFPVLVQRATSMVVNAALALHSKVAATFLPTAIKFHYVFNLRDLSNIFQVLLL